MLKYNIRGENINITDAIRDHIEKKVGKLERYFNETPEANVHVNLKVNPNKKAKVEITIPLPQLVLRAEEVHDDMYAAVDLIVDKLERQIRKHKTKVNRKFRDQGSAKEFFKMNGNDFPANQEQEDEDELKIVRTKQFSLKPMDSEEAVLQMTMLGHSFFIFTDAETNATNIVYRRKDGKYGLIETN